MGIIYIIVTPETKIDNTPGINAPRLTPEGAKQVQHAVMKGIGKDDLANLREIHCAFNPFSRISAEAFVALIEKKSGGTISIVDDLPSAASDDGVAVECITKILTEKKRRKMNVIAVAAVSHVINFLQNYQAETTGIALGSLVKFSITPRGKVEHVATLGPYATAMTVHPDSPVRQFMMMANIRRTPKGGPQTF